MKLWVGLGNPEPQMLRQRHNVGFMAIDVIAREHGFSPWRQRFKGVVAEGSVAGVKVLALKPLTYMNGSGESVQPAAAFFKLAVEDITAFHDELDLAMGKYGSSAAAVRPGTTGCAAWTGCWAARTTGACGSVSAIRAARSVCWGTCSATSQRPSRIC